MYVYFSLSVQRRLLAVSTVLDKCAWAVSSFHVDLPTLVNYTSTIRLSFRDFISQADQQLTRSVIFSIFVASVYYLFNFCCLRLLRVVLKLSRSAWDPRLCITHCICTVDNSLLSACSVTILFIINNVCCVHCLLFYN